MQKLISRRAWIKGSLAAAGAVPLLKAEALLAQTSDEYIARWVNPELQAIARQIAVFTPGPPLSMVTLGQARATMKRLTRPRLADVPVEKRVIDGAPGQPPVTIYVINARSGAARPGILGSHGGGFVSGTAENDIADLQATCKTLDCAAVAVEYRLAPETTFAGSIEDNYAGLKWLHANAASIGVDPRRIAVMGGSAGGGHAALLAITARDRGEVQVAFQCLIYPMLDDRTGSTRLTPAHIGKLIWNAQQNRFGWQSFLGKVPGSSGVPTHAVPARVEKLAGLPPAFIGVGTLDLFFDEDVEYARRLSDSGVPTQLITVPGAFHGFDLMPSRISEWFNAAKLDALRRGLGIAPA